MSKPCPYRKTHEYENGECRNCYAKEPDAIDASPVELVELVYLTNPFFYLGAK